jgi:hypothetical protein
MRKKIFHIGGTLNQITQLHQIADELPEYDHFFSPQYCDGFLNIVQKWGWLDFTAPGRPWVERIKCYIKDHNLHEDFGGASGEYDLTFITTDLIVPKNILNGKVVLVQEGMTDPENIFFRMVQRFPFLPRWIASSSTNGLSDTYDVFCVASGGYRELFIRKGIKPEKIVVTGIPNFDDCAKYRSNTFPFHGYVLVCTSDSRETFKIENRKKFIRRAFDFARGNRLIFKLHPNENITRATKEIEKYAPGALVFADGKTEEMIANCNVLITQYSSVVYVGIALGKEVYSYFDVKTLRRLLPLQNASAAKNIARVCRKLLEVESVNSIETTLELAS